MVSSNEESPTRPQLLSRRLIAFCDIIGFSQRLQASPIEELHSTYSRLMDYANTHIFQHDDGAQSDHRNFARTEFLFDSVLLVSNALGPDSDARSVPDFMSALASLFESSLEWQLPLRGAITVGDILEDVPRRISLSAAIPDLLIAEKEQEWAGVRILEPAVGPILEGLYGTRESEIACNGTGHVLPYVVPTKNGDRPSLVLNWVYLCARRDIDAGLSFLVGRKHDETERFVQAVNTRLPPNALLPENVRPAVTLRVRRYRIGFNIKFFDAEGNGADLPPGTTFRFTVLGQSGDATHEVRGGTG